jgi:proteasome lid subunit RPN8/RPN11
VPKKNLPRLVLPKAALAGFKKRALATEDEILAFLVGSITKENDTITKITVRDIVYPDIEAAGNYVTWDMNDLIRVSVQVQPDQVIGTIHSHPDEEPHISKADIETGQKNGELVSGIFSYWRVNSRRRTSFDFYYGAKILKYGNID